MEKVLIIHGSIKHLKEPNKKLKARNFDIRKTLIKFDNVLNDQRHVVFSQRKNAMNSQSIFRLLR
jgi:preprotein translocase subunit SecA